MSLLHIASLRQGADGRNAEAPNAANYDESKANPYPNLPDPLVFQNGKKVTSAEIWWSQRRPEIVELFDREIYGRLPKDTPKVKWEVTKTSSENSGEVPVITKQLVGHVDNSSYPQITVDIQLALTTPANATGPVPVIIEFGFMGGFPRRPGAPAPPPPVGPTWQQQVLAKGWGYAILSPGSIQADNGSGLTQGIIGLMNKGQPRKVDDWGALRAWAWGASRALDYLETDKSVDAKRVGIEGHSRYGKATLVTMAYDPRFAIAFVSSSGEGGAKIHRRNWGELVENVAGTGEYHWMAGNFLKYAGPLNWNDLPVDSHELVALCAPRPVFISAGATKGDGWVDAKGMFLAAVGAGPVYKLVGRKDLGATEFPPIETTLIDGDVAFRQHSAGHTPGPNWPVFLTFAGRYFAGQTVDRADSLDRRVKDAIAGFPGTVSIYARNLDTGQSYGLRENDRVRTASTIKLPIMATVFALVEKGRAKWSETLTLTNDDKVSGSGVAREFSDGSKIPLRDLVHLMIVVSDNTATNLILDRITADAVNDYMDKLGLKQTRSMRKVLGDGKDLKPNPSGWSKAGLLPENKRFGLGSSTPREMVMLLEMLERREVVSPDASKEMLAILGRQQDRAGIARKLGETKIANKSGALDHLRSDVGIVYSPRGKIALAITCEDIPRTDYSPDNPGLLLISQLTQILIEGLGKAADN